MAVARRRRFVLTLGDADDSGDRGSGQRQHEQYGRDVGHGTVCPVLRNKNARWRYSEPAESRRFVGNERATRGGFPAGSCEFPLYLASFVRTFADASGPAYGLLPAARQLC